MSIGRTRSASLAAPGHGGGGMAVPRLVAADDNCGPYAQAGAGGALQPPLHVPDAAWVERWLRHYLAEWAIDLAEEPLHDLAGAIVVERGHHALIVAADLAPAARVVLYLHALGHLALGHLPADRLAVHHEFRDRGRLPPAQRAREAAADAWARRWLPRPTRRIGANCPVAIMPRAPAGPGANELQFPLPSSASVVEWEPI